MGTAEGVWERLESIRDLVAESPPQAREAADAALALLAELADPPPDLVAFGAQIDGTAWRANGEYGAAEQCYLRAKGIYRQALAGARDPALRRRLFLGWADLHRRWAFLCLELRDWNRALEMLDVAEHRFTAAGHPHEIGRVCLARGQVLWERDQPGDRDQALVLLSRAVEMIEPGKSQGAFKAAEHNLRWALTLHPDPSRESLARVFETLRRGRLCGASKRPSYPHRKRQRFGHAERTVPDAKRRYLQGKVLLALRHPAEARQFLETARSDLMLLGNYWPDVLTVTLDLADCYLRLFRRPWGRVADLLGETLALCPSHHVTLESQLALELFQHALDARNARGARKHLDTAGWRHLAVE